MKGRTWQVGFARMPQPSPFPELNWYVLVEQLLGVTGTERTKSYANARNVRAQLQNIRVLPRPLGQIPPHCLSSGLNLISYDFPMISPNRTTPGTIRPFLTRRSSAAECLNA